MRAVALVLLEFGFGGAVCVENQAQCQFERGDVVCTNVFVIWIGAWGGKWGGEVRVVVRGKGKNRRNAHGRRWKTLEDVAGRRGEALQNRLEDVILI